jgi:hypothetical protein
MAARRACLAVTAPARAVLPGIWRGVVVVVVVEEVVEVGGVGHR